MNITIEDHPTPKLHPLTGEILMDGGKQVPAFPDQKCVKLDGAIIAYVLPNETVSFIIPKSKLGKKIVDSVMESVDFGKVESSSTQFVSDVAGGAE